MSTPVKLEDANSKRKARVTQYGELVTGSLSYSEPVEVELNVLNTAFNFIEPEAGSAIVITDIIAYASRNISNTLPANVEIYESDEADSLTVVKGIVSPQLLRGDSSSLIGLNLIVPEGHWVNAKTDDVEILLTIMFYRVPQDLI